MPGLLTHRNTINVASSHYIWDNLLGSNRERQSDNRLVVGFAFHLGDSVQCSKMHPLDWRLSESEDNSMIECPNNLYLKGRKNVVT